jgi:hypothetical protein
VSFAAPLYDMLEAGGFGRPKTLEEKEAIIPYLGFSWRHAAQTLGTEWGRNTLREDIWTMLAIGKLHQSGRYVFDDLRFENEAKAIRDMGGYIIHIRGRRGGDGSDQHASELGIKEQPGDRLINNEADIRTLHENLTELLAQTV